MLGVQATTISVKSLTYQGEDMSDAQTTATRYIAAWNETDADGASN